MDTGTIIMGTILLAIVVVPLVILGRKGEQTKHRLLNLLKVAVEEKKCQISEYEFCGDFVIGIDTQNNFVFFIKDTNENYEKHCIDVANIKNCKSNIVSRMVTLKGKNDKVIERLSLSFLAKNKNIPVVELEFYNAKKSSQLVGELQSLEKWQKIINASCQA